MENKIELKSINSLLEKSYNIPMYQRGYRWDSQQVEDLLNDIKEFIDKGNKAKGEFYCLQPIVVKQKIENTDDFKRDIQNIEGDIITGTQSLLNKYAHWEVIDGQQRLTTIKIILSFLECNSFDIFYQTRKSSSAYMDCIIKEETVNNIDFYHMKQAYQIVKTWFDNKEKENKDIKKELVNTLLNDVKVIWYETTEPDPVKVFTRLNIGKIPLTNAELIKALLLNKSNFIGSDKRIRLQQQEIASQWDSIEYQLQNDEFWLFLNAQDENGDKKQPTRIDFLFDLVCQKDILECGKDNLGTDSYVTYRYFDRYFKSKDENTSDKLNLVWEHIKRLFMTFNEWYNDIELYHYVGYLITCQENISDIYDLSKNRTKSIFKKCLKEKIRGKFRNITIDKITYGEDSCRSILLLFNIETTIRQCIRQKDSKYKLPIFYKFPFHLYKREKWDVEHIASQTDNQLEDKSIQNEWLKSAYLSPAISEDLKDKIRLFINDPQAQDFENLRNEILPPSKDLITKKDGIGNLALLDLKTNRGYKNAIFPTKRRWIIDKDQGKKAKIEIDADGTFNIEHEEGLIAFIPVCTRNVFLKYYSPFVSDMLEWTQKDAEAYIANIKDVLQDFIKQENYGRE